MRSRLLLAAPAAALALVSGLVSPALAAGPGSWSKLDPGANTGITNVPGLARDAHGTLHVVFTQHVDGSPTSSILHVPISPAGVVGTRSTAVSGWGTLPRDPKIAVDPVRGYHVLFAGQQNTVTENPLSAGNTYATYSQTGTSWTLEGTPSAPVVYTSKDAYSDYGNDTVLLPSGLAVSSYGFNGTLHVNVGTGTDVQADDTYSWTQAGTEVLDTHLAVRGNTVWMSWYQFLGGKDGVYVRQVYPALGPILKAPGSSTVVNGAVASTQPDTGAPTPLVATSAGLYTAYCTGYPSCGRIAVWRVGSPRPQLVVSAPQGQHVALSTAPSGRLWLGWYEYNGKALVKAVRTNRAVTRTGPVRSITPPSGHSPYTLQLDGALGRADVLVNTGAVPGSSQYGLFQTQILPGLSASASPKAVKHRAHKKVKVRVTDAGDPLAGALVKAGRAHCTTAAAGVCTLKVKPTRKKGKLRVAVSASGYAGTTLTIRRK
jgi:hypothetical protein